MERNGRGKVKRNGDGDGDGDGKGAYIHSVSPEDALPNLSNPGVPEEPYLCLSIPPACQRAPDWVLLGLAYVIADFIGLSCGFPRI